MRSIGGLLLELERVREYVIKWIVLLELFMNQTLFITITLLECKNVVYLIRQSSLKMMKTDEDFNKELMKYGHKLKIMNTGKIM
jgi:hypothetical protein